MARKKLLMGEVAKDSDLVFNTPASFLEFFYQVNCEIVLELACGKAAYVRELAKRYPNRFFIGVDVKADRIGYAVEKAREEGLDNVAFLNIRIEDLADFFPENSISEIWVTFADPFLKPSKSNRRLTAPGFLEIYSKMLKSEGLLHIKTDSDLLYEFSLDSLKANPDFDILAVTDDLYSLDDLPLDLIIQTPFEQKHLKNNLTIKYVLSLRKPESNCGSCSCCGE